jgi:hypothetical protein
MRRFPLVTVFLERIHIRGDIPGFLAADQDDLLIRVGECGGIIPDDLLQQVGR